MCLAGKLQSPGDREQAAKSVCDNLRPENFARLQHCLSGEQLRHLQALLPHRRCRSPFLTLQRPICFLRPVSAVLLASLLSKFPLSRIRQSLIQSRMTVCVL